MSFTSLGRLCKSIVAIVLIAGSNTTYSQVGTPTCGCPKNIYAGTKADTTFLLSNGKRISLCGYRDTTLGKGKVYFREFVLSPCGENKIIKFWEALKICKLAVVKDTLYVNTMVDLPIGKRMRSMETVWTIEPIYFVKGKVVRDLRVNTRIPKYNAQQIATVLETYNRAANNNSEATSDLADRLFVSTISGSKTARSYLSTFTKRFSMLDGIYLEYYDELIRMLKLWDEQNHND
jgi:hypothetical protein